MLCLRSVHNSFPVNELVANGQIAPPTVILAKAGIRGTLWIPARE